MGVGPLSHREIEAWGRLMRIDPPIGPFETDMLRQLDRHLRLYYAEKDKPKEKSIVRELADRKAEYDREQARKKEKQKK